MKKVPLMTQPRGTQEKLLNGQRSVSRGKEKLKQKQLKQEHRIASPNSLSNATNHSQRSNKKSQIKKQLFPISQFNSHISLITPSNKLHQLQTQTVQKHQHSLSFQRQSIKMSQKVYNVSLASARSMRDSLSQSKIKNSNQKKHMNKSQINNNTQRKNGSNNPFNQTDYNEQAEKWLQSALKQVKNESINRINDQFMQVISRPLKMQSQISKSSSHIQRCPQHNTPYSLYCTMDRQLLCVSCIYSQKSHKSHRILPLNRSQKQMKQDIDAFKNRIDQTTAQSQHLIRQASLNLIKIQRAYPMLYEQIEAHFGQIHLMIDAKKKEQLQYIEVIREQYRMQLKVIGQLLNKINNVILEKVKSVARERKFVEGELRRVKLKQQQNNYSIMSEKQQQAKQQVNGGGAQMNEMIMDLTVKTRCSYQTLSKYNKILQKHSDHLFDQRYKFDVKIQNFQQVRDLIKYRLAIVIPVLDKDFHQRSFESFLNGGDSSNNLMEGKRKDEKDEENEKLKGKVSQSKANQDNSVKHKREFSMAPQVPKGLQRRFL